jgi:hypothetical protein
MSRMVPFPPPQEHSRKSKAVTKKTSVSELSDSGYQCSLRRDTETHFDGQETKTRKI